MASGTSLRVRVSAAFLRRQRRYRGLLRRVDAQAGLHLRQSLKDGFVAESDAVAVVDLLREAVEFLAVVLFALLTTLILVCRLLLGFIASNSWPTIRACSRASLSTMELICRMSGESISFEIVAACSYALPVFSDRFLYRHGLATVRSMMLRMSATPRRSRPVACSTVSCGDPGVALRLFALSDRGWQLHGRLSLVPSARLPAASPVPLRL